jgi:hypothetical protein
LDVIQCPNGCFSPERTFFARGLQSWLWQGGHFPIVGTLDPSRKAKRASVLHLRGELRTLEALLPARKTSEGRLQELGTGGFTRYSIEREGKSRKEENFEKKLDTPVIYQIESPVVTDISHGAVPSYGDPQAC